jgi:hypothetical protein
VPCSSGATTDYWRGTTIVAIGLSEFLRPTWPTIPRGNPDRTERSPVPRTWRCLDPTDQDRATPHWPRKASRACRRALELATLGLARRRCGVAKGVSPANSPILVPRSVFP